MRQRKKDENDNHTNLETISIKTFNYESFMNFNEAAFTHKMAYKRKD